MPNYTNAIWSGARNFPTFGILEGDITVDVAVIGGGITGITAARLLKQEGITVALIESRRLGGGESGKTTAHLTEMLDIRYRQLVSRFGDDGALLAMGGQRLAIERIAAFVDELGIACQFQRVPGFLYAETAEQAEELAQERAAAVRLGVEATLVDTTPLPFPVTAALRLEEQAQFHPGAYLGALASNLDGDGCSIFERTHVNEVEDGRPCRVITDRGVVTAHDVIVASHVPISSRVLGHVKLAAYRSYAIAVAHPVAMPIGLFWDMAEPYHYLRSLVTGGIPYLIVGGEDHKVGEGDDTTVPFARLEEFYARRFGEKVAPSDHRWSGQIIEPADGLPYVGAFSRSHHIHIATGYAGNGMTQGTLAALVLADEIQGIVNPWARLLDARRFKLLASARALLAENVDFPKHLVADRLPLRRSADLAAIAPGEGALVNVQGQKLAVYRNGEGELSALSPVCTHLGCHVHWNTTQKSWDCPCHGSRFDPQGQILNGPATARLESRAIPSDTDDEEQPVGTLIEAEGPGT